MSATIQLSIICGKTTCARKKGQFCRFMIAHPTHAWGTKCGLFNTPLNNTKEDGMGWTLRCRECLENTVRQTGDDPLVSA